MNSDLSAILHPPPFDEADAYVAHPGQLVDSLKALTDRLGQLVGKVLVVEDAHVTTCMKVYIRNSCRPFTIH